MKRRHHSKCCDSCPFREGIEQEEKEHKKSKESKKG